MPYNMATQRHTKEFDMECSAIANPYCVEGSQALINPKYFISFIPYFIMISLNITLIEISRRNHKARSTVEKLS